MKRLNKLARGAAWASLGSLLAQPLATAQTLPPVATTAASTQKVRQALMVNDVALDANGGLAGQVPGVHGMPLAGVDIVVNNGRASHAAVSDAKGRFYVSDLQGGAYRVESMGQVQMCRVWKPGTAPQAAKTGLLIVQDAQLALGQSCGSPVTAGFAGAREALANPLIFGGIV
ncbi:MAG: carboxypeptidase regulatory-like domain-containing protein, partial [Planctomycetales bacterium]|nr:carboxypeptidase regulatory-like domain-containing protein [Planctomycetales bacterium]